MIRQIFDVSGVSFSDSYYGKKIRSLLCAYGVKYPFCRLYECIGGYFLIYESSLIADVNNADVKELSEFIVMVKPVSVEISGEVCLRLGNEYTSKRRTLFQGVKNDNNINEVGLTVNTSLGKCYDILCESFGITEYEAWYADISHKIRHGVSNIWLYDNTTVTMQFDVGGFVFVSHIATSKSGRGKGTARNLLYYLCSKFEDETKKIHLFALDERTSFYIDIGFLPLYGDCLYELRM